MPNSQDVPFVSDLLDSLEARCSIDPRRVFASGISRGGGMANRLGCDLADRIAAIGPVSGDYQFAENCSPSRPVPVIAFHGTNDSVIPYNGIGNSRLPPTAYFTIGTPIPDRLSSWAKRDGCSLKPAVIFQEGTLSGQEWGNCSGGADVLLYTINGGEHGWNSGTDSNEARMIWDFFVQHPLKQ